MGTRLVTHRLRKGQTKRHTRMLRWDKMDWVMDGKHKGGSSDYRRVAL